MIMGPGMPHTTAIPRAVHTSGQVTDNSMTMDMPGMDTAMMDVAIKVAAIMDMTTCV